MILRKVNIIAIIAPPTICGATHAIQESECLCAPFECSRASSLSKPPVLECYTGTKYDIQSNRLDYHLSTPSGNTHTVAQARAHGQHLSKTIALRLSRFGSFNSLSFTESSTILADLRCLYLMPPKMCGPFLASSLTNLARYPPEVKIVHLVQGSTVCAPRRSRCVHKQVQFLHGPYARTISEARISCGVSPYHCSTIGSTLVVEETSMGRAASAPWSLRSYRTFFPAWLQVKLHFVVHGCPMR